MRLTLHTLHAAKVANIVSKIEGTSCGIQHDKECLFGEESKSLPYCERLRLGPLCCRHAGRYPAGAGEVLKGEMTGTLGQDDGASATR